MNDYEYVLSFDPGKSSGIALGRFSDTTPYELVKTWQFMGGALALAEWVKANYDPELGYWWFGKDNLDCLTVAEKFTPLQNKGFAQTLDSTEPLRGEGALIALDVMPDYPDTSWRRPNSMYLYGGDDKKSKLKNARAFLKEHGMLTTGKDVGCKDANDAVSAALHGVSYVAQVLKHKPTMRMILGRDEDAQD